MAVAIAGVCKRWVTVATITQSICSGATPERPSALRAAPPAVLPRRAPGAPERLARRPAGHPLAVLLGGREPPLLDARALLDPLVAGVDGVHDVGVRDDSRRPEAADPEDGGVRRAVVGGDGGHQAAPTGCSRTSGCPGETRSPSSPSHSTTWPPC